jgi:DNA-binding GntR family transcriptional regulator
MDALPRQNSLLESVYEAVRDSICDGDLKPGERITQEAIAEKLDVSRQPVNQALILLRAQGFIQDAGRRGVMVTPLDATSVQKIYEIRAALDQLAARLAAERGDKAGIAEGYKLIEKVRAGADGALTGDLVRADMRFHELVYRLSGNDLIQSSLTPYWHHLRRVMAAVIDIGFETTRIWNEHEGILAAIEAGRSEQAAELAAAHVDAARRSLTESLIAQASIEAGADGEH